MPIDEKRLNLVAKYIVKAMMPTSQLSGIDMNSPAFEDFLKETAKAEHLPKPLLGNKVLHLLFKISETQGFACLNEN